MDQELIAYLDARFTRVDERFNQTSREIHEVKETVERLDGRVEQLDGKVGQLQIMVESMRDDIRQVAEGVIANSEKVDTAKGEVLTQFEEMRGLFRPMYMELDTRIGSLEAWRERTERDPLEIIRERFGKPKN